ncbi:MAG: FtsX-like permease family protein [Marinilabiliaceae bacterium]|jgi:lipoprotein-releasing system permease protein|nr:FtsX-like permease family protein [Marinilabiliaceae bacterium]
MKLSLYIARRYLFAKKSRNAINIISGISIAGVTVGTMALIIILSVFNGLENMVQTIFGTFDPDLEIRITEGKVFIPEERHLAILDSIEGIQNWSFVLEENALLRYDEKQYIASVKGVEDDYSSITGLDSVMWDGDFILRGENGRMFTVVGLGVAQNLGIGLNFLSSVNIYVPKRTGKVGSADLSNAFIRQHIFPSGIFSVEQDFDSRYIFIPIDMMRNLLEYDEEISAIEIKFTEGADVEELQQAVEELFGDKFTVKNKYQQQEMFYKVMRSERLAIFVILSFILVIASFNIIGSLTMLIIEKEKDVSILRSLGANNNLIKKIFIFEGWLISIIGAIAGLLLGGFVCWLQQQYGIVKLSGDTLVIDTYPVVMQFLDFVLVLITVLAIGFGAAWYPVRYMTKRYLVNNDENS